MVYDITNAESFDALDKWHSEFLNRVGTDDPAHFPFIILGNKCDRVAYRKVSKQRAEAWAQKNNADFFETSAKDMTGVEDAFMKSVDVVINKQIKISESVGINDRKEKSSLKLSKQENKKKGSCC